MQQALARLPFDQREALLLVAAEGISYADAAAIIGTAVGTVKSRVNRASGPLPAADGGAPGADQPAFGRFNYDRTELWADALVHAMGVGLALAGVAALLFTAADEAPARIVSIMVYSVFLLLVLSTSATYNLWPISPTKWKLRRIDHAAIYLHIAGTYTAFVAQMSNGLETRLLLASVWAAALVGATMKVAWPGRFDRLAIALYIAIGWSGVVLYDRVTDLPPTSLQLLLVGGILYTAGVAFHVWESLRFQNAIWHGFVLLAASCHYAAILDSLP